jgi:hypothetical protein
MKWGKRWEDIWGWKDGPDSIPTTVEVMIVRGQFKPCDKCKWYTVCVVPKNQFLRGNMEGDRIRDYYQCEDFVNRTAKNTAAWYQK